MPIAYLSVVGQLVSIAPYFGETDLSATLDGLRVATLRIDSGYILALADLRILVGQYWRAQQWRT